MTAQSQGGPDMNMSKGLLMSLRLGVMVALSMTGLFLIPGLSSRSPGSELREATFVVG